MFPISGRFMCISVVPIGAPGKPPSYIAKFQWDPVGSGPTPVDAPFITIQGEGVAPYKLHTVYTITVG